MLQDGHDLGKSCFQAFLYVDAPHEKAPICMESGGTVHVRVFEMKVGATFVCTL